MLLGVEMVAHLYVLDKATKDVNSCGWLAAKRMVRRTDDQDAKRWKEGEILRGGGGSVGSRLLVTQICIRV